MGYSCPVQLVPKGSTNTETLLLIEASTVYELTTDIGLLAVMCQAGGMINHYIKYTVRNKYVTSVWSTVYGYRG